MLTKVATPMIIAFIMFIIVGAISAILINSEDKSKGVIFGSIMVVIFLSGFIGFRLFDNVKKWMQK
jgi:phosphatidylglycerophosphatase A